MSVPEEHQDVITTVLILMEAIIVLAWMDMNWNQIITLVQVMTMCYIHTYVRTNSNAKPKVLECKSI